VADRKTVTRQTLIGEAGINLIAQRALEMGHLFHPRRVDHGIDGHLDLVERGSGALLNLTILVQSKASDAWFPGEDAHGFHYLCDPRDLALWLSGNAPVIVVFSHPTRGEAWWCDIKAAFPDAASRAARRIHIDKNRDRFDRDAAAKLLCLGAASARGLYLQPTPKPEHLTSNLMPVLSWPPNIYQAATDLRSFPDARERLRGAHVGAWIFTEGQLVTFDDLNISPLRDLTSGPVLTAQTTAWAQHLDPAVQRQFVELLTRTIQNSYPQLRWHNARRHVHVAAPRDLRQLRWPSGGGRQRTVFKGHRLDNPQGGFYAHAALRLRPRDIAGEWFLQINPDYCFTSDGRAEHRAAHALTAGIKRLDRHPALAGLTRTWAQHLLPGDDLFAPHHPVQLGPLVTFDVELGIDDEDWGSAQDSGSSLNLLDDPSEPPGGDPLPTDLEGAVQELLDLFDDEIGSTATPTTVIARGAIAASSATADRTPRRGPRRATRPAGHAR